MIKNKSAKKIIKELAALEKSGLSVNEIINKFSKASDFSGSRLWSMLKILNTEKDNVLPDKDLYHKLLQKTVVTNQNGIHLPLEEIKGRETNFLLNFNNFFMTFNPKVITAVSLVVVLGGVFAFWQLSPTFQSAPADQNNQQEVDLSDYAPATVVAVKDVDSVVDSIVSDADSETSILSEEELDIYLADAESEALGNLEQLYEPYEL